MTTFKVGDRVKSPKYGKGMVVGIFPDDCQAGLPMCVRFKTKNFQLHTCGGYTGEARGRWYDLTGNDHENDQLTLRPPKKAKAEPRPFAVGDVVWVKGTVSRFNETRVEVRVDGSYEYWTWKGSVKHAED